MGRKTMTRPLPAHITPSAVIEAASNAIRASASKQVNDDSRRRAIHPDNRQFWIEQAVSVFLDDLFRRLPVGGGDDFCI